MIADFIRLYKNAVDVHDLKVLDTEEYKAFVCKRGNPVKLVSVRKHFEVIPHEVLYYDFFNKNPLFWVIPLDLPDKAIVGFVLRSFYGKQYTVCNGEYQKQVLYGLHDFKDFRQGMPIVVCEGAKDREYLAQFYPYCVACLSASPSRVSLNLLRGLTNKLVLALDNDDTGMLQVKRLTAQFRKIGAMCEPYLPRLAKDWGGYFSIRGMESLSKLGLLELLPTIGRKKDNVKRLL